MRLLPLALAPFLLLVSAASTARADAVQTAAEALCSSKDLAVHGRFDKVFDRDSVDRVISLVKKLRQDFGPCQKVVRGKGAEVEYVHAKAIVPGKLYVTTPGQISGIWFAAPRRLDDSIEAVVKELRALPGTVALTVRELGGKEIVSLNARTPLAVGSTFKLYILKALREQIDRGKLKWTDIVTLRRDWRSLPSGKLQDWPDGAPLTLHSLATLMISISDNTATDHLLFHLGRAAVERLVSARNRPFLSTAEMFKLKSAGSLSIAERYARATESERRKVLEDLKQVRLEDVQLKGEPSFVREIEWFFSTDELCRVLGSLKDLDMIGVNGGLAERKQWARIGYKGGSESGVLNLTHVLEHPRSKRWYCVAATWNDPRRHLQDDQLETRVQRLLQLLSRRN
jgi:beta-lactamase class A